MRYELTIHHQGENPHDMEFENFAKLRQSLNLLIEKRQYGYFTIIHKNGRYSCRGPLCIKRFVDYCLNELDFTVRVETSKEDFNLDVI